MKSSCLDLDYCLGHLTKDHQQQLEYAFEQGVAQYVTCSDVIVGVYLHQLPGVEIIEEKGAWGIGRLT